MSADLANELVRRYRTPATTSGPELLRTGSQAQALAGRIMARHRRMLGADPLAFVRASFEQQEFTEPVTFPARTWVYRGTGQFGSPTFYTWFVQVALSLSLTTLAQHLPLVALIEHKVSLATESAVQVLMNGQLAQRAPGEPTGRTSTIRPLVTSQRSDATYVRETNPGIPAMIRLVQVTGPSLFEWAWRMLVEPTSSGSKAVSPVAAPALTWLLNRIEPGGTIAQQPSRPVSESHQALAWAALRLDVVDRWNAVSAPSAAEQLPLVTAQSLIFVNTLGYTQSEQNAVATDVGDNQALGLRPTLAADRHQRLAAGLRPGDAVWSGLLLRLGQPFTGPEILWHQVQAFYQRIQPVVSTMDREFAATGVPGMLNLPLIAATWLAQEDEGEVPDTVGLSVPLTVVRPVEILEPPRIGYVYTRPPRATVEADHVIQRITEREVVEIVQREVQKTVTSVTSIKHFSRADYVEIADQVYTTLARRLIAESERLGRQR